MVRAGFAPALLNLLHSFCVKVLQASGDITLVQKLRGHRNIATTMIYTTPSRWTRGWPWRLGRHSRRA